MKRLNTVSPIDTWGRKGVFFIVTWHFSQNFGAIFSKFWPLPRPAIHKKVGWLNISQIKLVHCSVRAWLTVYEASNEKVEKWAGGRGGVRDLSLNVTWGREAKKVSRTLIGSFSIFVCNKVCWQFLKLQFHNKYVG